MLPVYGRELPEQTHVGKQWRRNAEWDPQKPPKWRIGTFIASPDPSVPNVKWSWAVDNDGNVHQGVV